MLHHRCHVSTTRRVGESNYRNRGERKLFPRSVTTPLTLFPPLCNTLIEAFVISLPIPRRCRLSCVVSGEQKFDIFFLSGNDLKITRGASLDARANNFKLQQELQYTVPKSPELWNLGYDSNISGTRFVISKLATSSGPRRTTFSCEARYEISGTRPSNRSAYVTTYPSLWVYIAARYKHANTCRITWTIRKSLLKYMRICPRSFDDIISSINEMMYDSSLPLCFETNFIRRKKISARHFRNSITRRM